MAGEMERLRTREREATNANYYEINVREQQEFADRQATLPIVIKPSDRQWLETRQGRLKYYVHHQIDSVALDDFMVFANDIRHHGGKHRHQGGIVIYVIEGEGYSVVDGERHNWKTGDVLLLPLRPGGTEHQHYNIKPGTPCRWMAFIYRPYHRMNASQIVPLENSPDWQPPA